MKPEAERFVEEMLPVIRKMFFAGKPEKQFYQEQSMLMRAITYPAYYIEQRGAFLPASAYRRILTLVLNTARLKGDKPERPSAYLVACIESHMLHHGEDYYYEAKVVRDGRASSTVPQHIGKLLPSAIRSAKPGPARPDETTAILAAAHRTIKSRGGRRRAQKEKACSTQPDLFKAAGVRRPALKPDDALGFGVILIWIGFTLYGLIKLGILAPNPAPEVIHAPAVNVLCTPAAPAAHKLCGRSENLPQTFAPRAGFADSSSNLKSGGARFVSAATSG